MLAGFLLAFAVPTVAVAAFPGADPEESVRLNTPSEEKFDRCEPDDEDGTQDCTNVFDQSWQRFGFAPDGTSTTATYKHDGCLLAVSTLTLVACGDAHTRRLIRQNLDAGRFGPGQVSGVSADRAWKRSLGDPRVEIAILDTGIRWGEGQLRTKISLNGGELPTPENDGGPPLDPSLDCADFDGSGNDLNDDGAFNVLDFACDGRVAVGDGHDEADGVLDPSDLIARFSNGDDGDANGYPDDIAGWDFFDDDNDPYDASSYSSASNHGTGRAEEAAELTDDAGGDTGLCPECQVVPLRVWDTFVLDTNYYAQGVAYAADNDIEVVEGAIGGLTNSRFSREAFEEAYEQGVFFAIVSSDLNTASHNFPTTYDEAMMVQGTVADTNGLGIEIPGGSELLIGLNELLGGLDPLLGPLLGPLGIELPGVPGTELPVGTWFRNSGTTQYGGHAHVAMPGTTGSEATGQAAGAAGLIESYGREQIAGQGLPGPAELEPNEVKQIMTLTAEDVRAENTDPAFGATGALAALPPDPAQEGWDRHFGYGRPDLGLALETIADGEIPPQAMITSPDWFAPFNVEQQDSVEIEAAMSAKRVPDKTYDWRLEWAPGVEPAEDEFTNVIAEGDDQVGAIDGGVGSVNLQAVREALDNRQVLCNTIAVPPATGGDVLVEGGAPCDPTAPGKGVGDVDPNEPAFTVRLVVTDSAGNRGEDRKVMFAYREPDAHEGSSRPIGRERDATGEADSGGEASQRMYDLDGDNDLEIVEATSSGELYVFKEDGTPLQSFNGGEPVLTQTYGNVRAGAPFYQGVEPPREALRTPAIGDIDGDLEPEIVDTAGERIYAWEADGGVVDGFPFRTDPSLSRPEDRTKANHVKPGFIGSPVLGNLDEDPELEIVAAALDQHLYGLDGDGRELPGFPVYLRERDADGTPLPCTGDFECAESINTPAIGDMNADGEPEIVIATNEFADNPDTPGIPDSGDLTGLPGTLVTLLTANLLGGEGRTYAVDRNGEILDGWPVKTPGTLPDALPLIGPGHDYVLGDIDGEPGAEAIGAVTTGELQAFDFSGASAATFPSIPQVGETPLALKTLSFFEYPILADLDTTLGDGPEVAKAGISLTGLLNVGVTTGLNLPYNHLMQAWSTTAGGNPVLLPAYPQPIEDYQLLSSPAAADVSDADGVELLAGTGMYLIRNLNSAGVEGSGWPKFTGGWAFAVPATGDVDRDGMLEVSVMTREGFSFLWDTHRPACTEDGGDNQQWWTSRHDEWSTGAYETDSRPPGVPEDLAAVREPDGSVTLSWTAPGDDWLCGQAARVRVLGAEEPLERAVDGLELTTVDADAGAGEKTSLSLSAEEVDGVTDAAVTYRDDVGNWGRIATVEIPPVPSTDPPDPSDPPDPAPADCDNPRRGSAGSDFFVGGPDSDGYRGRGGGDELRGKGGSDCLWGGAKADELAGARGDDLIKGGRGIDDLRSGPGNDRVRGGRGGDTIRGGGGEDDLRSQRGHDTLRGGGGDDLLRGGKGRDRVRGGGGDDRINVKGGGRDVVNCGKGDDTVRAGSRDRVLGNCERVRRGRSG